MNEKETETVFVEGMKLRFPSSAAPDYILVNVDVNADDLMKFIMENKDKNGHLSFTIKRSKNNTPYIVLDDYWMKKRAENNTKEGAQNNYPKYPQRR